MIWNTSVSSSFTDSLTPNHTMETPSETYPSENYQWRIGFQCSQCDETFSKVTALSYHFSVTHSNLIPDNRRPPTYFKCTLGPAFFYEDVEALTDHYYTTHQQPTEPPSAFTCLTCKKEFKYNPLLQQHINLKHKKKKIKEYACPLCNLSTTAGWILKRHINALHNLKKGNKCHLCSFETATKWNLKMHLKKLHSWTLFTKQYKLSPISNFKIAFHHNAY